VTVTDGSDEGSWVQSSAFGHGADWSRSSLFGGSSLSGSLSWSIDHIRAIANEQL